MPFLGKTGETIFERIDRWSFSTCEECRRWRVAILAAFTVALCVNIPLTIYLISLIRGIQCA